MHTTETTPKRLAAAISVADAVQSSMKKSYRCIMKKPLTHCCSGKLAAYCIPKLPLEKKKKHCYRGPSYYQQHADNTFVRCVNYNSKYNGLISSVSMNYYKYSRSSKQIVATASNHSKSGVNRPFANRWWNWVMESFSTKDMDLGCVFSKLIHALAHLCQ